jgi:AcrR family transcriptional regulator
MARAGKAGNEEMSVAERRRLEIIQAAYKVFSEKGYHSTRINDITSELNIARGLFYHYFESKLDIYTQIIEGLIVKITNGVVAETRNIPTTRDEFIDQMWRLGERLLDILTEEAYISKLLFVEVQGIDKEVAKRLYYAFDLFGQYTQLYLRKGVERGFLRPDIPIETTALAINAMIIEGARFCVQAQDKMEAKRQWVTTIGDLILQGLVKPEN